MSEESSGIAEATAQMCSSKAEARKQAKEQVAAAASSHGYHIKSVSRYEDWTVDVGSTTYYYCKAWAEVFK